MSGDVGGDMYEILLRPEHYLSGGRGVENFQIAVDLISTVTPKTLTIDHKTGNQWMVPFRK